MEPPNKPHSAIIFSGAVIKHIENDSGLRLPSTYVGVHSVRDQRGGGSVSNEDITLGPDCDANRRKRHTNGDIWVPSTIADANDDSRRCENNVSEQSTQNNILSNNNTAKIDRKCNHLTKNAQGDFVVYKVTNPDGTQRRMTKREKRQLKYQLKQANHLARKEEQQKKHDDLIREQKAGKRKRLKRLREEGRKRQTRQIEEGEQQKIDMGMSIRSVNLQKRTNHAQKEDSEQLTPGNSIADKVLVQSPYDKGDDLLSQGGRSGIPPVMLTPAATCIVQDMGALQVPQNNNHYHQSMATTTIMDQNLSSQWASQLQQCMSPAEKARAKEPIRPMAYKVVPEAWKRLFPYSLWSSKGEGDAEMITEKADAKLKMGESQPVRQMHYLVHLRNPSPSYDRDAYAIFRHLHHHSKLHIDSGALFGCDFLLYDGSREDRHSFAGLRVYSCSNGYSGEQISTTNEVNFPIPSAYDIAGYVRTMNTARKLALVGTVLWDDENNAARVAIVDLALEKILDAPTHLRKGNARTTNRRSEDDTASCLARKT